MRVGAAIAVLCSVGVASADPPSAAVEKVVRANLAAAYTSHAKLEATTTKDFVFEPLVDENREPWWEDKCGAAYCNDEVMLSGNWVMIDIKSAPFTPTIVVDDTAHVAYFAADLVFSGRLGTGDTIVVKASGRCAPPASPSTITAGRSPPRSSRSSPPTAPARELAAWFPGHLADHQSARAFRVTGTSARDVATDRAAMTRLE